MLARIQDVFTWLCEDAELLRIIDKTNVAVWMATIRGMYLYPGLVMKLATAAQYGR